MKCTAGDLPCLSAIQCSSVKASSQAPAFSLLRTALLLTVTAASLCLCFSLSLAPAGDPHSANLQLSRSLYWIAVLPLYNGRHRHQSYEAFLQPQYFTGLFRLTPKVNGLIWPQKTNSNNSGRKVCDALKENFNRIKQSTSILLIFRRHLFGWLISFQEKSKTFHSLRESNGRDSHTTFPLKIVWNQTDFAILQHRRHRDISLALEHSGLQC